MSDSKAGVDKRQPMGQSGRLPVFVNAGLLNTAIAIHILAVSGSSLVLQRQS